MVGRPRMLATWRDLYRRPIFFSHVCVLCACVCVCVSACACVCVRVRVRLIRPVNCALVCAFPLLLFYVTPGTCDLFVVTLSARGRVRTLQTAMLCIIALHRGLAGIAQLAPGADKPLVVTKFPPRVGRRTPHFSSLKVLVCSCV
jgi:hypothetical protein